MQCVTSTTEMPNVERISRATSTTTRADLRGAHGPPGALRARGQRGDCLQGAKQKETVDKKLIVDAMQFGMSARERPLGVVLITGDGDYAYLLSRLRGRGCSRRCCSAPGATRRSC